MPQHNPSSYGYSSREFSRALIVSLDTGGTFSNDSSSLLLLTDPPVKSIGIIISGGGGISVGVGGGCGLVGSCVFPSI